jgi:hypothetical protein
LFIGKKTFSPEVMFAKIFPHCKIQHNFNKKTSKFDSRRYIMTLAQVVYNISTDAEFATQWKSDPEAALANRGLMLSQQEKAFLTRGLNRHSQEKATLTIGHGVVGARSW